MEVILGLLLGLRLKLVLGFLLTYVFEVVLSIEELEILKMLWLCMGLIVVSIVLNFLVSKRVVLNIVLLSFLVSVGFGVGFGVGCELDGFDYVLLKFKYRKVKEVWEGVLNLIDNKRLKQVEKGIDLNEEETEDFKRFISDWLKVLKYHEIGIGVVIGDRENRKLKIRLLKGIIAEIREVERIMLFFVENEKLKRVKGNLMDISFLSIVFSLRNMERMYKIMWKRKNLEGGLKDELVTYIMRTQKIEIAELKKGIENWQKKGGMVVVEEVVEE